MAAVKELLDAYRSEMQILISAYYAWKTFNNNVARSENVLASVNENAAFWNISMHSLQVTFFVALGRIFDGDNRSLSARNFINGCRENIHDFNKAALAARKIESVGGKRPRWLDGYLQEAYEPVLTDFDDLNDILKKNEYIYKEKYKPIRDKFIAHKDIRSSVKRDEFFGKTNIGELENLMKEMFCIYVIVDQFYINGNKFSINECVYSENELIEEEVISVLEKISI